MNPISPLITQLEHPANLNLDELLSALRQAATDFDAVRKRATLAEYELQRELKALVELTGPTPVCDDPELAWSLHGESLALARRDAKKRYNDLFRIQPIRRT